MSIILFLLIILSLLVTPSQQLNIQTATDFLQTDKTNERTYYFSGIYFDPRNYACFQFTRDLIANASAEGVNLRSVLYLGWNTVHWGVWFDSNGKIYYIEPQTDVIQDAPLRNSTLEICF